MATAGPGSAAPPGLPKLTAQTLASGGAITPEQASVSFDHVDLAIEVKPATQSIAGIATLEFTAKQAIDHMTVDLDPNLPVSAVAVDDAPLGRDGWSNPVGRLRIALPGGRAAGQHFALRIAYGGVPHVAVKAPWDGGFVWSQTVDGKPWMATAVQGEGCDLFWPCLDHPMGEPALADVEVTVPKGLSAPGNGRLIGVRTRRDGRTIWHWRARQPNTYAIALDVGPFKELKGSYKSRFGNTIPLQLWYLPGHEDGARRLFAEFAPTLDFFESTIGPYPFGDEKVGVVETPHEGMEHQTINAYGYGYRQDINGFDWLFQHEFGHEWFGNQMTNADWDDFWLHEGYDSYMQPLYARWRGGDMPFQVWMQHFRGLIHNRVPIVSGKPQTEEAIYDGKQGPGQDIYNKAAWMLHTLRWLVGDDKFFEITRRIVYGRPDPKPGNFHPRYATTAEYEAIVRQVTGRDYGWFFDIYLRQAALPALTTERRGDMLTLRWVTPGGKPFPMPIEIEADGKIVSVGMADGVGTLAVSAGEHVIVDPRNLVLRRSEAVDAMQAWDTAARAAGAAGKK